MTAPARWIKTCGDIVGVEPKEGREFSLRELQEYVGGYIDIVRLDNGLFMVVNDDGLNDGLPQNQLATALVGQYIAGDVVVCDRRQIS